MSFSTATRTSDVFTGSFMLPSGTMALVLGPAQAAPSPGVPHVGVGRCAHQIRSSRCVHRSSPRLCLNTSRRVPAEVAGQIGSLSEPFPTEVTAEGLLSGVDLHVSG